MTARIIMEAILQIKNEADFFSFSFLLFFIRLYYSQPNVAGGLFVAS